MILDKKTAGWVKKIRNTIKCNIESFPDSKPYIFTIVIYDES
jgi:hypothetical protein